MTDTNEKEAVRNPFRTQRKSLEAVLDEIPRRDISFAAGFVNGFCQREMLSNDERQALKLAGKILHLISEAA